MIGPWPSPAALTLTGGDPTAQTGPSRCPLSVSRCRSLMAAGGPQLAVFPLPLGSCRQHPAKARNRPLCEVRDYVKAENAGHQKPAGRPGRKDSGERKALHSSAAFRSAERHLRRPTDRNATQQLHRRLIDERAEPAARGSRNHDPHATLRCVALGHDGTAGRAAQRARRDRRRLPTT